MTDSALAHEQFLHIRVILSTVLGLSLARLINGVMRFIQHPEKYKPDLLHLGWVAYMFLSTIDFWWFEFQLNSIERWGFLTYLFVIFYAMVYVALAALLFPDDMSGYSSYGDYFQSRQRWFYGILALFFLFDVVDTLIKGRSYALMVGQEYWIHQLVFFLATLGAFALKSRLYQNIFVIIALLYEVSWAFRVYEMG